MKFISLTIAAIAASTAQAVITISHGGLPVTGPSGSTGCIPTCYVYTNGHRGCEGRADFIGACNTRNGDTVRPVGGCGGVDVRWIANADGNGVGTMQVQGTNGWDEFDVYQCDSPTPTSIRCTYDGGCDADQI
ncbi:hypothetical protein QBC36DRAFT_381613 [Triangularia setosa]|uniref:Uncharacterized protein n=1 Tax=Triangularia setosa TaxID=2587417 RepID=A0AAN7A453_9PEZI|nr:hypothetical protein QBC36DRAFT_381613 [Podospora setosa]